MRSTTVNSVSSSMTVMERNSSRGFASLRRNHLRIFHPFIGRPTVASAAVSTNVRHVSLGVSGGTGLPTGNAGEPTVGNTAQDFRDLATAISDLGDDIKNVVNGIGASFSE